MKPSDFKELLYEKENATGIVTVTMNMPKRRNALSLLLSWSSGGRRTLF